MGKVRRRIEGVVAAVLVVTNSTTWTVISKLSDIQFLYNAFAAAKPYLLGSLQFVRNWGWVVGVGLLCHIAYESRRARGDDPDGKERSPADDAAAELTELSNRTGNLRELSNVASQLKTCKDALDQTQKDRESVRAQLIAERDSALGELETTKQSLLMNNRELAVARLEVLARRNEGKEMVVRYIAYEDHDLADHIASIFRNHAVGWAVTVQRDSTSHVKQETPCR